MRGGAKNGRRSRPKKIMIQPPGKPTRTTAGHAPVQEEESTDVFNRARQLLQQAIEEIPDTETAPYRTALSYHPELVQKESHPCSFLRACNFNSFEAARKIVEYWKLRLETFGNDRCYRSVTDMDALDETAVKIVETGVGFLLPNNTLGRTVLYYERAKFTPKIRNRLDATADHFNQALFYHLQLVANQNASNKAGFIVINIVQEDRPKLYPRGNQFFARAMKECFPILLKSMHMICVPRKAPARTFSKTILPFLWQFWLQFYSWSPRRTIDYVNVGGTNNNNTQQSLANLLIHKCGLNKDSLPSMAGGPFSYEHFKEQHRNQSKTSSPQEGAPICSFSTTDTTESSLKKEGSESTRTSRLDLLAAAVDLVARPDPVAANEKY